MVTVARGYMRNYLLPRGHGGGRRPRRASPRSSAARSSARSPRPGPRSSRASCPSCSGRTILTLKAKAGDDGRLFGSITSADVATAIEEARGVQRRPAPHHGGAPHPGGGHLLRAGGARPRADDRGEDHRQPADRLMHLRAPRGAESHGRVRERAAAAEPEAEAMLLASLMEVGRLRRRGPGRSLDADDFYREGHRAVLPRDPGPLPARASRSSRSR